MFGNMFTVMFEILFLNSLLGYNVKKIVSLCFYNMIVLCMKGFQKIVQLY